MMPRRTDDIHHEPRAMREASEQAGDKEESRLIQSNGRKR
jgi:hypothetical protein